MLLSPAAHNNRTQGEYLITEGLFRRWKMDETAGATVIESVEGVDNVTRTKLLLKE